jgi:Xaa-Pro aminopeptidase
MLFMGNVRKTEVPYKELADLSLRFWPSLVQESSIGFVDENYQDSTGNYEYYNVNNIYYRLGYWNDEIYRFGVVYIMKDYTLSPVFNIRGIDRITTGTSISTEPIYNGSARNYIPIDKYNFSINSTDNCKGVCRISSNTS